MNNPLEELIPRHKSVPSEILALIRSGNPFSYRDIRKIVGFRYRRPYYLGDTFIQVVNRTLGEKVIPTLSEAEKARLRKAKTEYEADLRDQVKYDSLTGILARRYVENELPKFIKKHPKSKIILLDIDHFKKCNDDYGHGKGDETLKTLGKILDGTLADFGLVARWGGEEFIAVVPDEVEDIDSRIEEVRKEFSLYYQNNEDFKGRPCEFKGTLSMGIFNADFSAQAITVTTAIQRADEALYQAKKTRDTVKVWKPAKIQ